jgi:hypothetical protein
MWETSHIQLPIAATLQQLISLHIFFRLNAFPVQNGFCQPPKADIHRSIPIV